MNTPLMWGLIIGAAVIVAAVFFTVRRRRTERLRQRFGAEYDRTVSGARTVAQGEAALIERQQRVEKLQIRPLPPDDARRFSQAWRDVQTRFVDDPTSAIVDANRLVGEVMHARGYPVGDFEQRVADVSVDHPNVVMNYRAAKDIVDEHERGTATTEDMRQAMVHYRALFAELVDEGARPRSAEPAATTGGTRR